MQSFTFGLVDVRAKFPTALCFASSHVRATYATQEFVGWLVRNFYQTLNVRETRRRLVDLYFTLFRLRGVQCGLESPPAALHGPQTIQEVCQAVP